MSMTPCHPYRALGYRHRNAGAFNTWSLLTGRTTDRPMVHDLMWSLLESLMGREQRKAPLALLRVAIVEVQGSSGGRCAGSRFSSSFIPFHRETTHRLSCNTRSQLPLSSLVARHAVDQHTTSWTRCNHMLGPVAGCPLAHLRHSPGSAV